MSTQNGQLRPKPLTGRKLKWTTKKLRLFFKLVKLHGAVSPAAEIVNIPGSTARQALHQGRTLIESYGDERPAPEHADRFPTWFARMTQHCLGIWELSKLSAITDADASGKRPAAGAMWRLERAIATDYGPPVQVTIEAEGAAALALWAREQRQGHQSSLPLPVSHHGVSSDVPQTEAGGGERGGAGTEDTLTTSERVSGSGGEQVDEAEWVEVES